MWKLFSLSLRIIMISKDNMKTIDIFLKCEMSEFLCFDVFSIQRRFHIAHHETLLITVIPSLFNPVICSSKRLTSIMIRDFSIAVLVCCFWKCCGWIRSWTHRETFFHEKSVLRVHITHVNSVNISMTKREEKRRDGGDERTVRRPTGHLRDKRMKWKQTFYH